MVYSVYNRFPNWFPKVTGQFSQFSHLVVSDSLRSHGLQHTRPPCPSPIPRVCSNSCSSSWWCHPTISSSVIPFSFCLQSPSNRVISNKSVLRIRWPKYWRFSFSISPSSEYLGLISFSSWCGTWCGNGRNSLSVGVVEMLEKNSDNSVSC